MKNALERSKQTLLPIVQAVIDSEPRRFRQVTPEGLVTVALAITRGIAMLSSGTYTQIETRELTRRGLTIIGPLGIMFAKPEQELRTYAETALSEAAAGRLVPIIGQTYPLARAADAHAALEARETTGNVLLIP